jgi:O-antigen ligase
LAEIATLVGLVIFGSNLFQVVLQDGPMESMIGLIYMVGWGLGLGMALLSGALPRTALQVPLLTFVILLAVASTLWSVDPQTTLFRSLALVATSAFGFFLGHYFDLRRLILLLAINACFTLLISTVLIFAVPSIGIDDTDAWRGAWIGAFTHKNSFGAAVAGSILVLFYAMLINRGLLRLCFGAMLGLAFVLLVGSLSSTSLVMSIVGMLLATAYLLWQRARGLSIALFFAASVAAPVFAMILAQIDLFGLFLEAVGKDATVSGRTDIWYLAWPYITDRFWLGYGYDSFWQPGFPWFSQFEARLYYAPYHSHNGVLEFWIACGLVGVIAVIVVFFATMLRAVVLASRDVVRPEAAFPVVFLVCLALRNITEAGLVGANSSQWAVFVALAIILKRDVVFKLRLMPAETREASSGVPRRSSQ